MSAGRFRRRAAAVLLGLLASCNPLGQSDVAPDYRPDVVLSPGLSRVICDRSRLSVGDSLSVFVYARDSNGQPFVSPSLPVAVAVASDANALRLGAVVNLGDGSYRATATALQPGRVGPLTVRLGDGPPLSPNIYLEVASAALSATPLSFTVTPPQIEAGGQARAFLRLQDTFGAPLAHGGQEVRLAAAQGGSSAEVGAVEDLGDGSFAATLVGQRAGGATAIVAQVDGLILTPPAPPSLQVLSGPAVRLAVGPDAPPAGVAVLPGAPLPAPLQVLAQDAALNPVAGLSIAWTVAAGGGHLSGADAATDAAGLATVQLTAGPSQSRQEVRAQSAAPPLSLSFFASVVTSIPKAAAAQLQGCPPTVADGSARCVITVTLLDAAGQPAIGLVPQLAPQGAAGGLRLDPCSASDGAGEARCGLASTAAGEVAIALTRPIAAAGPAVLFVAGPPDARASTFAVDNSGGWTADGQGAASWTATLRDAHGNPVAGFAAAGLQVGAAGSPPALRVQQAQLPSDAAGRLGGSIAATAAGTYLVGLEDPSHLASLPPAPLTFAAWRGVALAATSAPAAAVSQRPWAPQLRLEVVDAAGQVVTYGPDSEAVVTVSSLSPTVAGNGGLAGLSARAAVAGVADFAAAGQSLATAAAAWTLTAQATLSGGPVSLALPPFAVVAGPATRLSVVATPSAAVAGSPLASVVVEVQDLAGNRVATGADAAAQVSLSASVDGAPVPMLGSLSAAARAGEASFSDLRVEGAAGALVLSASASLGGLPAVADAPPFAVVPGAASQLQWRRQPPASALSLQPFPSQPLIYILDAVGNLIDRGADAGAQVALRAEPAGSQLVPTPAAVTTAVAGIADFSGAGLAIDRAGTTRLIASKPATQASGALEQASSATLVGHAAAASLRLAGPTAPVVAGLAWGPALSVEVVDAAGNPVLDGPDATAALSVRLADGAPLSGTCALAAVGGGALFADLTAASAGSHLVVVEKADTLAAGGRPALASTLPLTVVAGPAAALAFAVAPGDGVAAEAWTVQPQVEVRDLHGNRVQVGADARQPITLSLAGGGPLAGPSTQPAAAGLALFSGLSAPLAGPGQVLTARAVLASGPAAATSPPFALSAAAASALRFLRQPDGAVAGREWASAPRLQVVDASGNLCAQGADAGAQVGLAVADGGDTLEGATALTAAAGVVDFAGAGLRLWRAAAGRQLRATAQAPSSGAALAAALSDPFLVSPGPATALRFVAAPTAAVAGAPLEVAPTVEIVDAAGNVAAAGADAGSQVTLTLTAAGAAGVLLGTAAVDASQGVATFPGLQAPASGPDRRLVASASLAAGAAQATSAPFSVAVGPATALRILTAPLGATASGLPWSPAPAVQVVDAQGNSVVAGPDSVASISLQLIGGALQGTLSQAASAGLADFAGLGIASPSVGTGLSLRASKSDTRDLGGTPACWSDTPPFALTVNPLAHLSFAVQPAGAVAGDIWGTQPRLELRDASGLLITDGPESRASVAIAALGDDDLQGTQVVEAVAGVASFTDLARREAGPAQLLAQRLGGPEASAASEPFTVSAGPATALVFRQQPGGGVAGSPWVQQPILQVVDAVGNPTGGSRGEDGASVSLGGPPGVPLSGSLSGLLAGGAVAFADVGQLVAAPAGALTAAVTLPSGVRLQATSSSYEVTAGPAAGLRFAVQPSFNRVGRPMLPVAGAPAVEVVDAWDNRLLAGADAQAAVHLAAVGGGLEGATAVAAVGGLATFSAAALGAVAAGPLTLVAEALLACGARTVASLPVSLAPAPAARLAFVQQPGGGVAGQPWPQQPQLQITDVYGNLVAAGADASAAVVLSSSVGPLQGATSLHATGGVVAFADVGQGAAQAGGQLTARAVLDGQNVAATSSPFAVAAGPAAQLVYRLPPASVWTSGEVPLPAPQLAILDAQGNLVASGPDATASVTLSAPAGPGALGGSVSVNAAAGVADFAGAGLTWDLAGSGLVLRATKASTPAPGGSVALSVDAAGLGVVHGPAAQLQWATLPAGGVAGQPLAVQPVVRLLDAAGNLVVDGPDSTAPVTVLRAGGGPLAGATTVAAAGGVASFGSVECDQAGAQQLLARKASTVGSLAAGRRGTASLLSAAASLTVSPAAAGRQLVWSLQPGGGVAGQAWPQQPVVQLQDLFGNLVSGGADGGAVVSLAASGDGGALYGAASQALSSGAASFAGLSLQSRSRAAVLVASAAVAGQILAQPSAPFAVAAGPAAQLVFAQQPGGGVAGAGWAQQPRLALWDAYRNVVDAGGDSVATVALSLSQGNGALSGAASQAAAAGVADFAGAGLALDRAGADKQLTAQASVASGTLTATSGSFAVAPGAGVQLVWSTQPGGAVSGQPLAAQPVVQVQDALGRPITSGADGQLAVTLSVVRPSGAPLAGTLSQTAVGGAATFTDLVATQSGTMVLSASAATSSGRRQSASASFTVQPGAAASLALTTPPSPVWVSGAPVSQAPVFTVLDAAGNPVTIGPDATAAVSLALGGGAGALSPAAATVSAVAGVASFAGLGLRLDLAGGGRVLTASKASTAGGEGVLSASSGPLTVLPGPASQLVFVAQPASATAGSAFSAQPVVSLRDAAGNLVSSGVDASATIALGLSSGWLSGTSVVAAVGGVATFSGLSASQAGSTSLTASKGDTSLTLSAGSRGSPALSQPGAPFVVSAGPACQLSFTTQPGGGAAGAAWAVQPVVQVQDAQGNVVSGGGDGSATVALSPVSSSGAGALAGATSVSAASGVASFAGLSTTVPGAALQLRASATLSGTPRTATSGPFAVAAGPASRLAFVVQPGGSASLSPLSPQPVVQVQDSYGNPVASGADAAASVSLSLLGGGGGVLRGATTRGAWGGQASFAGAQLSVDVAGAGRQLVASAAGSGGPLSGTSASFAVSPGPASQLAFVSQPGGGVAHQAWAAQPQVAVQDASGNTVSSGADGNVTLTVSHQQGAGGGLNGAASVAAVAGVASFAGLSLDGADSNHRLQVVKPDTTAAGGTLPLAASSAAFSVTSGAAAQLAFTRQPTNAAAGSALGGLPLLVQVQDAYANLVSSGADSSRSLTLSVASGGGALAGTLTQTALGGVATFSGLSTTTAGTKTLAATATLTAGSRTATSQAFTTSCGPAAGLAFASQPGGGSSRAVWGAQPVVWVVDAYGNLVASGLDAGRSVSLTLPSGSGSLLGTASALASGGIATFAGLSIDAVGTKVLTAAAQLTVGNVATPSASFAISPGPSATSDWPFNAGSGSSYTFSNTASISPALAGGLAALTAADQSDSSGAQFALGSGTGVVFDSNLSIMRLGTANGCAGMSTNCAAMDASWAPQYSKLLGYWRFDGSGSIADGTSIPAVVGPPMTAHNANGTGMAYVTGLMNQGILLDGTDDYLTLPDNFISTPTFSLAGWVDLTSFKDRARFFEFCYQQTSNRVYQSMMLNSNIIWFVESYAESSYGGCGYPMGVPALGWTHLAFVFDGRSFVIYVNGNSTSISYTDTSPVYYLPHKLTLGSMVNGGSGLLPAKLDEVAIWGTALTPQEVAHIYSRQRAPYAGTFTSRVYDGLAPNQTWSNFAWKTTMPFLKQLPSNQVSETSTNYSGLTVSNLLTSLKSLWHFTEASAGTVGTCDFLDDTGGSNNASFAAKSAAFSPFSAYGVFGNAVQLTNYEWINTSLALSSNPNQFTYQAWVMKGGSSASGPIMGLKDNGTGSGAHFDRILYYTSGNNVGFGVNASASTKAANITSASYGDNQWHHIVGTFSTTGGLTTYIDGQVTNANATFTAAENDFTGAVAFGYVSDNFNNTSPPWPGNPPANTSAITLNEAAVWTRVLSPAEVLSLYRRGANRLRFQVRTCVQPACIDNPAWTGPDGTTNTYYSELNNISGTSILATSPNPAIAVAPNRYFQYRAILESDDVAAQCSYPSQSNSNVPCSPELISVSASPPHYDSTSPNIGNASGLSFNQIAALTTTLGAAGCAAGVSYTLSYDGVHWFWYNGSSWVTSTNSAAQSTTSSALTGSVLQKFAAQAGTGTLFFTAFLNSNGQQPCAIDDILFTVNQ